MFQYIHPGICSTHQPRFQLHEGRLHELVKLQAGSVVAILPFFGDSSTLDAHHYSSFLAICAQRRLGMPEKMFFLLNTCHSGYLCDLFLYTDIDIYTWVCVCVCYIKMCVCPTSWLWYGHGCYEFNLQVSIARFYKFDDVLLLYSFHAIIFIKRN